MKRFLLLSLLVLLSLLTLPSRLKGQIVLSANDLSFTQREGGPTPHGQTVGVSGTGNISLGVCTYISGAASVCPAQVVDISNGSVAPAVANLYLNAFTNNVLAPGTYVWSQDFLGDVGCTGSCTLTLTLTVVAATPQTYSSPGGTQVNCVHPVGGAPFDANDLAVCDPYPGGLLTPGPTPFTMFGGPGHTVVDPTFNNAYQQMGADPPHWMTICGDAITNCFNSDDTLMFVTGPGGDSHILVTAKGVTAGLGSSVGQDRWQPAANTNDAYWSVTNPMQLIDFNGLDIRAWTFHLDGTVTTSVLGTAPVGGGNTRISAGNDTRVSGDNWFAASPDVDNVTFLINLNTNPATFYVSPVWPHDDTVAPFYNACHGGGCPFAPRLSMISAGINAPNSKRYFIQQFNGGGLGGMISELYSMVTGSGVIVDEGQFGGANIDSGRAGYPATCASHAQVASANCFGANIGHQAGFVQVGGVTFYVTANDYVGPAYNVWELGMRVDVGQALQTVSAEAGGGLFNLFHISNGGDNHSSCSSKQPICTSNTDFEVVVPSWDITAAGAVGINPETITTDTPYSGANGDSVLVNGAWQTGCGANTGLNGIWTVSNLVGNNLTINSTGSGTRDTYLCDGFHAAGAMVKNVAYDTTAVHQSEVDFLNLTNLLSKQVAVGRLLKTRSVPNNSNHPSDGSYFNQGHWTVSDDGQYVAGNTNNGVPGILVPFMASTGFAIVAPALSCPATTGTRATAYSSAMGATGGTPAYTFTLTAGALPTGLALNNATGAVTGTPSTAGVSTFTGQVTDATSATATANCTITISNPPVTLGCPAATGTVSIPYSSAFAADAGTPPYTFALTAGSLPTGLGLDTGTGAITGTPSTAQVASFTGQVTDSNALTATASCSITVTIPPLTVSCPGGGQQSIPYISLAGASGGTPPYTFVVRGGTVPPGIALANATSGAFVGIPTTAAIYSFSLSVTDSLGAAGISACSLSIVDQAIPGVVWEWQRSH